jgi:hypothetical protein
MGCQHGVDLFDLLMIFRSKLEVRPHCFQLFVVAGHDGDNFGVQRAHSHERAKKLLC